MTVKIVRFRGLVRTDYQSLRKGDYVEVMQYTYNDALDPYVYVYRITKEDSVPAYALKETIAKSLIISSDLVDILYDA